MKINFTPTPISDKKEKKSKLVLGFTKMVASGNDFVVIRKDHKSQVANHKLLAREICDRKFGVGADGMLLLEKSKKADVRMRIFNADGSEAEMCGNGARCTALYVGSRCKKIETKAGIIETKVNSDKVKIKLTAPKGLKLNLLTRISGRTLKVNFIDTGVPHAVVFVEGLDKIDVVNLGRQIRYHGNFAPRGANADFVEALNNHSLAIRTYERGVEDETLACGTGSVASALIFSIKNDIRKEVNIHTKSTEVLKVYFDKTGNNFKNVWLEGKAKIVYKGVYNV